MNGNKNGKSVTIGVKTLVVSAAVIAGCVLGGLWIAGCADAALSVDKGMNYITYRAKSNRMNVVSRAGFEFYLDHFTDAGERRREVDGVMNQLEGLFGGM